jgi:hypothetical protein
VFGVIMNLVLHVLRVKTSYTDRVQAKDENRKLDMQSVECSRLVFELSTPASEPSMLYYLSLVYIPIYSCLISALSNPHFFLVRLYNSSLRYKSPTSDASRHLSRIHVSISSCSIPALSSCNSSRAFGSRNKAVMESSRVTENTMWIPALSDIYLHPVTPHTISFKSKSPSIHASAHQQQP